jgi:hypothetical protein
LSDLMTYEDDQSVALTLTHSFESLLAQDIDAALELRLEGIEAAAQSHRADAEAAKISLATLTLLGAVLSSSPLIAVFGGLGFVGYCWAVVRDFQKTKRLRPIPTVNKTLPELLDAVGLAAIRTPSATEHPFTDTIAFVEPALGHEYRLLVEKGDQVYDFLTQFPAAKRLKAYRYVLRQTLVKRTLELPTLHVGQQALDSAEPSPATELQQPTAVPTVIQGEGAIDVPATQLQGEPPAAPDVSPNEVEPIAPPDTFAIPVESVPDLQPPAQPDDRFAWAKDLLNFPAVLIWGPQGSGKTCFAAWLLRERIKAGHTAEVWDVHREYGQWQGLPVFGDGMDYEAVDRRMLVFENRVKADYKERASNPKYNPKRHTIVCEEFTNFARRCEHSAPFFEASLSDLRKVKKGVIFVSHDRSLIALGGSKGFSKARNNGLLELQLEAKIDPATGDPMPALKGKLKYPGKVAIDIEIATWMKGEMDFSGVVGSTSQTTSTSPPPTSTSTSPEVTSEEVRKLEALYYRDGSDPTSPSPEATSPPSVGNQELYNACKLMLELGKSKTWVVENVLGCKGRKFEEGKVLLEALLKQFGEQAI